MSSFSSERVRDTIVALGAAGIKDAAIYRGPRLLAKTSGEFPEVLTGLPEMAWSEEIVSGKKSLGWICGNGEKREPALCRILAKLLAAEI